MKYDDELIDVINNSLDKADNKLPRDWQQLCPPEYYEDLRVINNIASYFCPDEQYVEFKYNSGVHSGITTLFKNKIKGVIVTNSDSQSTSTKLFIHHCIKHNVTNYKLVEGKLLSKSTITNLTKIAGVGEIQLGIINTDVGQVLETYSHIFNNHFILIAPYEFYSNIEHLPFNIKHECLLDKYTALVLSKIKKENEK